MSETTLQEFIEGLVIPEIPEEVAKLNLPGADIKDDKAEQYVDDGSLLAFGNGVSPQHKEDVLNSCLLAQLAATHFFDRWTETEQWYKKYVNVLSKVGWVIGGFEFTTFSTSDETFTVEKVVLQLLEALLTPEAELLSVQEMIDGLDGTDDESSQLKLYDNRSTKGTKGNTQISAVSENNGTVSMNIAAVHFTSTSQEKDFLLFHYRTSTTTLFQGKQTSVLNDKIYGTVRQKIIDKLGSRATAFIDSLPI